MIHTFLLAFLLSLSVQGSEIVGFQCFEDIRTTDGALREFKLIKEKSGKYLVQFRAQYLDWDEGSEVIDIDVLMIEGACEFDAKYFVGQCSELTPSGQERYLNIFSETTRTYDSENKKAVSNPELLKFYYYNSAGDHKTTNKMSEETFYVKTDCSLIKK